MSSRSNTDDRCHASHGTSLLRRRVLRLLALFTVAAGATYFAVVAGGVGVTVLEAVTIPIFMILFAWVAQSFLLASAGLMRSFEARRERGHEHEGNSQIDPQQQTAILIPVYNEDPHRVCAGVRAMLDSLATTGFGHRFDVYILSDTTVPETWLQEQTLFAALSESTAHPGQIYYRHRAENKARKSGNIADFCERWGPQYEYMIVLDADSLLAGTTMVELVRRMNAEHDVGILQVPTVPIGRWSLFARLQQFAAQVYGPVFAGGLARWAGNQGNYWGHNAIIRVRPFMEHCELPVLEGAPPFGGEILSHDFVEAALMVRAGWKVQMATDLKGSYEECPTTIDDFAVRDQRWCQGNLQHTSLLLAEGFNPLSRFHFATGIMAYLSAPIWGVFVAISLCAMAAEAYIWQSPSGEAPRMTFGGLTLFASTMVLLMLPKLWGVILLLSQRGEAARYGGTMRLGLSVLLESFASILLSPIMAIYHARFVWNILRGTKVSWTTQNRNETGVTWREAVANYLPMTLFGGAATLGLWLALPSVLPWFSPLLVGLWVSIPLAVLMGSSTEGRWLATLGLLRIPEETDPGYLVRQHQHYLHDPLVEPRHLQQRSQLACIIEDPVAFHLHRSLQVGCEQSVSLDEAKRRDVLRTYRETGACGDEFTREILLDTGLLEELHVESQRKRLEQFLG